MGRAGPLKDDRPNMPCIRKRKQNRYPGMWFGFLVSYVDLVGNWSAKNPGGYTSVKHTILSDAADPNNYP